MDYSQKYTDVLSDAAKKSILRRVIADPSEDVTCMDERTAKRALKSLDKFLYSVRDDANRIIETLLELPEICDANAEQKIKNFIILEQFIRLCIDVLDPEFLVRHPVPTDGNLSVWTLSGFIKEWVKVGERLSLSKASKPNEIMNYKNSDGYLYHYLICYYYRNNESHLLDNLSYSEISKIIRSVLICMLSICDDRRDKIDDAYRHSLRGNIFDASSYCSKIVKRYNAETDSGFSYEETLWSDPKSESGEKYTVDALIMLLNTKSRLKLSGIAGTGKTTALRRIEYLMAKKLANPGQRARKLPVPVFIPLYSISKGNDILQSEIVERTGIPKKHLPDFLENESLCILLDGFNEILDINTKTLFARQVDEFEKTYPKALIVLSDRDMQSENTCPIIVNAKNFRLVALTDTQKADYVKKNCKSPDAVKIILDAIKQRPHYFDNINTPMKFNILITCVEAEGSLPADMTESYLNHIIRRELVEKKDSNMHKFDWMLAAFATLIYNEASDDQPFEEMIIVKPIAFARMKSFRDKMGMSTPDIDRFFDIAINLDILQSHDRYVGFARPEYLDYYQGHAFETGIIELLA